MKIWHWDAFIIYCLILLFAGWLAGFMMPRWLATVTGGAIGIMAVVQGWFESTVVPPRRRY